MIQTIPKPVTFDEFIAWYPENSPHRYELHDGEIIEMPLPTGKHSKVAGFTAFKFGAEIERAGFPYFIPKQCIIKPNNDLSGYDPDVIVLDEKALGDEPRWERESIITKGTSIPLVIEVISTNWSDDYALKLEEYEAFGIREYWIVDYLGLGGKRFIGNPKQPTITVNQLVNGEYQAERFTLGAQIKSLVFPELALTTDEIFQRGR
ncbi:Uma2 family endonuclease [Microseira sp. BLCC-F43]|jgi:Uma2 family endonuclease|uniref:Uma2 family endonuclease n=1 Tax=Microseira sp. BLCC-F43 TaxID=3153602 RepID=UPI0035BA3667